MQGLLSEGLQENRNFEIEYRWAENRNDRLALLAAELAARRVDVIVVLGNTSSAFAAKAATSTIPIVFRIASDPVELGLVASLSRPGANITGVTTLGAASSPKQLELLRDLAPGLKRAALLVNPANPALTESLHRSMAAAARDLGLELNVFSASDDAQLPVAFAAMAQWGAHGLVIGVDTFFNARNERLAALCVAHAMPAVSPYREFAEAGGLLSYGGNISEGARLAGIYVGRILKGEKPGVLPVQQITRIELILNRKTAKALGLSVSEAFEARADEVIE